MRNKFVLGVTALTLLFSGTAPAFANNVEPLILASQTVSPYVDTVPSWAAAYIKVLTELGILEGYPDGTIRAAEDITRAEFSVALSKAMFVVEQNLRTAILEGDKRLYDNLTDLQFDLLSALNRIDALEAALLIESNNFVALSIIYNAEDDVTDDNAYISLDGKFEAISISDTFKVSIRPFVNTTGEAGAAATLDAELTDKLTLAGGVGYAGSWSDNSALAGDSNGVTYAQANVDYDLSNDTVITLSGRVPVEGDNSGDINFGIGFGVSF